MSRRICALSLASKRWRFTGATSSCCLPLWSVSHQWVLTELEIRVSLTTSRIITSRLSTLHQLKCLILGDRKITHGIDGTSFLPRIRFFEGSNSSVLCSHLTTSQLDPALRTVRAFRARHTISSTQSCTCGPTVFRFLYDSRVSGNTRGS